MKAGNGRLGFYERNADQWGVGSWGRGDVRLGGRGGVLKDGGRQTRCRGRVGGREADTEEVAGAREKVW